MTSAGLRFTGHSLIDVGVAGVCAFLKKGKPEDVTMTDLDQVSEFLVDNYYQGKLGTFLCCVFMNASFVQPKEKPESRQAFIKQYLKAHRAQADPRVSGKTCVFSGQPATCALVRTHLPMFSGEDVINFRPDGQTWVPAAGPFVVALMFLPMAGRRAEGKLLIVHADDIDMTMEFARRYVEENRKLIALALPVEKALIHSGYDRELVQWDSKKKKNKFADVKGPRSFVVHDLTEIASRSGPTDLRPRQVCLMAYVLSNSGQDPSLDIFEIPSSAVMFILKATQSATRAAWKSVSARFEPLSEREENDEERGVDQARRRRKKKEKAAVPGRAGWTKNPAFEEMCNIFEPGFTDRGAAGRWIRRYVLGRIGGRKDKPRYEKTDARVWALAELFLKEVMGMNEGKLKAIRSFADKIADWINKKNDRKLSHALAFEKLWELRRTLLRVQRESAKDGDLIFGLDEYATVWLRGEDGHSEENLVRDLICIRVVEKLHELGYYKANPDELLEAQNSEETKASEEE